MTQFLDNYNNKQMVHFPPSPSVEEYKTIAYSFVNKHKQYSSVQAVRQGVCKLAAIELSAQPFIRKEVKKRIGEYATITTELKDQG